MDSFTYRDAAELCDRYNRATNPAKFRTAHQHRRCNNLARAILRKLNAMHVPWTENDYSGKIRCGYYIIDGK